MLRVFNKAGRLRRALSAALLLLVPAAQAGDILRGGAAINTSRRNPASGAKAGAEAAAASKANAKDRLARTTAAIDAVKAMQQAARNAAAAGRIKNPAGKGNLPPVRDGLGKNGLQVAPGVPKNLNKPKPGEAPSLWTGAKLPKQTNGKNGEKSVTIVQTEQQAILNWETFHIGKKTDLYFDQTKGGNDSGKWVAFNKINDPSGRPSQILGSLRADGQVYVINQNGIIFGGSSQVNTHTLVASALPINANLISSGLLNNTDAQFLFTALVSDTFDLTDGAKVLSQVVDSRSVPALTYTDADSTQQTLVANEDYTLATNEDRQSVVTLTETGEKKLALARSGTLLTANYVAINGDVTVAPGARLSSPTTAAKVGGRVMLAGANVRNSGTISTPDGQTILAAGLQIGVAAHASADPSLRGIDVFVGALDDATAKKPIRAGTAINDGLIDIPRANATLAGKSVRQDGVIDSTTSVSLNGRVDLDATYDYVANANYDPNGATEDLKMLFVPKSSGVVTLGESSVIRILPEIASDETLTGDGLAIRSRVNARGLAVHFDKDSQVLAPNAQVDVKAGKWNFLEGNTSQPPSSDFVFSTGQIYVDKGALIDVAGTTAVDVPLEQSILTLELRGAELANSPLQRDGLLRNTTITIDSRLSGTFNGNDWIGTPLGDASGFLDLIEKGAGQLTVAGGSVTLQAGESVVLQRGSTIDVSGGWLNNKGGLVKTTKVMHGARLIDISEATPDQIYDGIYDPKFTQTHSKWGISKTYRHPLSLEGGHFESDTIQGAAGGDIAITAASMALDGQLTGRTVKGPKQIRQSAVSSTLPDASSLSLTFKSQDPDPRYGEPFLDTSLHAPRVTFDEVELPQARPFSLEPDGSPRIAEWGANLISPFHLPAKRRNTVALSPALLSESGFGELSVDNSAGDIELPAGRSIDAPVNAVLTLEGRNIDIQGSITAPGGSLTFVAHNISPYLADQYKQRDPNEPFQPIYADPEAGRFTLGQGSVLSTAGLTIDQRDPQSDELVPIVTQGGKVDVTAFDARLAKGSLIDVAGGVLVDRDSGVSYGDAGLIAVRAGKDPSLGALFREGLVAGVDKPNRLLPGRLRLQGELRGYSGAQGGALALQAPFIQVGGEARERGTLLLQPGFFDRGGFTSFDLTGIGGARTNFFGEKQHLPGLVIAEGTVISPHATSLFANPHPRSGDTALEITREVKPRGERAPVSLAFHSLGLSDDVTNTGLLFRGDLVMGAGAAIFADPLASVDFSGSTVAILGTVDAPAGSISVSGSKDSVSTFEQSILNAGREQALTTVYLGSQSRLSTRGTTVVREDASGLGLTLGAVLPGGTIKVSGNIAAARGSVLDVSGASGVLDFSRSDIDSAASRVISARSGINAPLANRQFAPVRVDSDGGAITLEGGEQLFTDATLLGRSGGPTALGGSLDVSSGRFSLTGALPTDPNLVVTQDRSSLPVAPLPSLFSAGEQTLVGQPVLRKDGEPIRALGYFSVDTFAQGGFDSLSLGGAVSFRGPVSIEAHGSLKVATNGVIHASDDVRLSAPYVALGMPFRKPSLASEPKSPFTAPTNPYNFGPTRGPGTLTVEADLIDIGTLSLRNMRRASFLSDGGDIRGEGTLHIAGNLLFRAGQIYTPSALSFTTVAYDYKDRSPDAKEGAPLVHGSIRIQQSGARQLPLSAGGTLSFYASEITQNGTLRAPLGAINLGWDGTGDTPQDLIAGDTRRFPITQRLTLGERSMTSVSAIDPLTGEGTLIPYGVSIDGNTWIDPTGTDITLGGLPEKRIALGAERIATRAGSQIDLRGGGDLYAYRWVEGNQGTRDILGSEDSFAILPSYEANYAPAAAFNDSTASAVNLSRDPLDATTRDPGYVNANLHVGDRIRLGEGSELPAGSYTLLPARYALLPGAYLVTPTGAPTIGALAMPDGSALVSGSRYNSLSAGRWLSPLLSQFEVLSADVIHSRARYDDFTANRFLRDSARLSNATPQLVPADSGHLVFQATEKMNLSGAVLGQAPIDGRGAFIDVSSTADIVIAGSNAPKLSPEQAKNTIVLRSSRLDSWGAESLLVGGVRRQTEEGTVIDVRTGRLTVDNRGSSLRAPEILLAANEELTVSSGSRIEQSGRLTLQAERLSIDGDGAFLRVSSDTGAQFARLNVTDGNAAKMTVGAGAALTGSSLTLDSSKATDLSAKARLRGRAVNLQSGQISLRLDDAPDLLPTDGLVLAGRALRGLATAESISLLSYSSLDIYGEGEFGSPRLGNLSLHAGQIRGFNDGGVATFTADRILLDNAAKAKPLSRDLPAQGKLAFRATSIELGDRALRIDQFTATSLRAAGAVVLGGKGRLLVANALDIETPNIFAVGGATAVLRATGDVTVRNPDRAVAFDYASGMGASLTLQGTNVTFNSDIELPSGIIALRATTGDLKVNGRLDAGGTAQQFLDLLRYTPGGEIELTADRGSVSLGKRGALSVAAQRGGGDAGSVSISAASGRVDLDGELFGAGGRKGAGGTFSLDVGSLPELAGLNAKLDEAAFTESRSFRVRNGNVTINGSAASRVFRLSADRGSIFVNGTIDASGATGGAISLLAAGSIVLADGALLDASGETFSNAGKGGAISLEAGSQVDGVIDTSALLDIRAGSKIDLSVAAARPDSADLGLFTGTLHLRAPQTAAGTDLQMAPISGEIRGASSIAVEGYKLFDLTATNGSLSGSTLTTLRNSVMANGNLFAGAAGTTTATYAAMLDRLMGANSSLESVLSIRPGAEITHRTGSITLGTATSSNANDDWNFSNFRFGPKSAPGVLTMRAAQDLVFNNALHDGFAIRVRTVNQDPALTTSEVYQAPLLDANPLLPLNAQSWSYRLTAGADFQGADYRSVAPLSRLVTSSGAPSGSLKLGRNVNRISSGGQTTEQRIANRYQVIRTGSGDIDVSTGRDVQLLNQFATIYTAGTKVADPTMGGRFDLPVLFLSSTDTGDALGDVQQITPYPVQYSLGGGDVAIRAQGDITHLTRATSAGPVIADSQRQLPVNWLYRRGYVDPTTGAFGVMPTRISPTTALLEGGDVASTTWWIDFSNFFEGIGALGGGNVSLLAGGSVRNVDAVIPTNARQPKDAAGADELMEFGGGDLVVRAGADIDAGVYYVERGRGVLSAGNSITTNSTRSPSIASFRSSPLPASSTPGEQAWLPTTLFLGKGRFDVSARGDLLLGPTANPFLLPGGLNNSIWYKTYFSTYAPTSAVNVSSLGGTVTLRTRAALPGGGSTKPLLQAWLETQLLLGTNSLPTASIYHPWLRLNEPNVNAFPTATSILPPTLRATAFTGDLNLVGSFNLSPASRGTLELAASGAINGLQPTGSILADGESLVTWGTTRINVSDALPSAIPGVAAPYAYRAFVGALGDKAGTARESDPGYLLFLDQLFNETGSLGTVLETKQTLHAPGPLHADDPEPLRLYALAGDISGITLFSPKAARIVAGQDIIDNAFYIQNLSSDDVSVVAAGRNLLPYEANSPLRTLSQAPGNLPPGNTRALEAPLAGDIQLAGPGTLIALAGAALDLGTGAANADGTGTGITTVGNARNPYLPFEGANIVAGAGIGSAAGLDESSLDFEGFIEAFLLGENREKYLAEVAPKLTEEDFLALPAPQRDRLAIEMFYLVLRDAGRNENAPGATAGSGYAMGFSAIDTLFAPSLATGAAAYGNIDTRARDIRTRNGGNISLFAPRGELTLATSVIGNPLVPPGIITESGGDVSIFTEGDVDIGIGRIFTLRGGDMIIWSSMGDIAAGAAARTVKSAPPTRVLIDPQSGDVQTDLAGLATGGGIGVLATVAGVAPGDVDLIAPNGVVDAGDAGIRVSGNLNIAATAVLNASNISVAGSTTGVPVAPVIAAPNIAGLASASTASGAANQAASDLASQARPQPQPDEAPSIIDVQVVGYGGGEDTAL